MCTHVTENKLLDNKNALFNVTFMPENMYLKPIYRLVLAVWMINLLTGCGEKVPLPHAKTGYEISYSGNLVIGDTISFQSTAPAGSTFKWTFGDGVTSLEATPKHTYYRAQSSGALIIDDTVTLIVNNDIYYPNMKFLRLKPAVQRVKGTHTWKGGKFTLHGGCCPGLTNHALSDTTFVVTVTDSLTVKTWGTNLPFLADSNYFSNERNVGHFNATWLKYTKDTLFFRQRSGTDTGWAETTYYHKY